MQFYGEIAAIVYQRAPKLPSFPPAIISGICSEHEQHRNRETKQCMHLKDRLQMAIVGKFQPFQFYEADKPGEDAQENDEWQ